MTVDFRVMEKFIQLIEKDLTGEWILIGGGVLHTLGIDYRSTTDIDFVGKTDEELKQTLKLMDISESLGLSIEAVNQAGGYFLKKIPNFENHLVLLTSTPQLKVYRPNLLLYCQLKLRRGTETDREDVRQMIQHCKLHKKQEFEQLQTELRSGSDQVFSPENKAILLGLSG